MWAPWQYPSSDTFFGCANLHSTQTPTHQHCLLQQYTYLGICHESTHIGHFVRNVSLIVMLGINTSDAELMCSIQTEGIEVYVNLIAALKPAILGCPCKQRLPYDAQRRRLFFWVFFSMSMVYAGNQGVVYSAAR